MTVQMSLVNNISSQTERFNEDLIHHRKKENILERIKEICRAFEVVEYITFLEASIESDETKITQWDTVNIDRSRVSEVTLKFQVDFKGESEIVEKKFFIPKLVDDFYFDLKGVRYCPVYQIVDRGVFTTPKIYSMKTMMMPIRFKYKKKKKNDDLGNRIDYIDFELNIFKFSIPFMYYFLAEFGLEKAIQFFGYDLDYEIQIVRDLAKDEIIDSEDFFVFKINKTSCICFDKDQFESISDRIFMMSLVRVLTETKCDSEKIEDWKVELGKIFTRSANAFVDKADNVLFSLKRVLDERTKTILDNVEEKDKEDIFTILRWMIINFESNRFQDGMDLKYKRIQCWEYVLNPLLKVFSSATYRIQNSRNLKLSTVVSTFNSIRPNFLVKKLLTNDLVRYDACVNVIDSFSLSLKVTFRGQGSAAANSDVSDSFRAIHPSYIGRLSLITTGATDPGISTTIVPFAEIKNGIFVPRPYCQADYENELNLSDEDQQNLLELLEEQETEED
jgi:hypothetical protein